jgi:phage shock protein A
MIKKLFCTLVLLSLNSFCFSGEIALEKALDPRFSALCETVLQMKKEMNVIQEKLSRYEMLYSQEELLRLQKSVNAFSQKMQEYEGVVETKVKGLQQVCHSLEALLTKINEMEKRLSKTEARTTHLSFDFNRLLAEFQKIQTLR